ncbi:uncharacterized protein LOC110973536 [Acanthaster planci]|uniref:Uncharacterized protein LOC110973536 n=1 Tax=Acanthaster planci TaxID=133434 RepID=A0A8B7XIT4_ACAPL|nr:uncharacterized protein LOC110973536 [Acanthaster planci]
MERAGTLTVIVSALAALMSGVEGTARTCYFGPPPKPDPNNPGHWMQQVMREIRERCPGNRDRIPAAEGRTEPGPAAVESSTPVEDVTIPNRPTEPGSTAVEGSTPKKDGMTLADLQTRGPRHLGGRDRMEDWIPDTQISSSSSDNFVDC